MPVSKHRKKHKEKVNIFKAKIQQKRKADIRDAINDLNNAILAKSKKNTEVVEDESIQTAELV